MASDNELIYDGANEVIAQYEADVHFYAGPINDAGFADLIRVSVGETTRDNCLLILATNGGSGKTAYRIGHFLQSRYTKLIVCAPSHCKSAGTLVALAAHELIMDAFSELGPLDMMGGQANGEPGAEWDRVADAEHLSEIMLETFQKFTSKIGSSRVPSMSLDRVGQQASALIAQAFAPLFAQLNAQALARDRRNQLAITGYARRLTERSKNVLPNAVSRLVQDYPIHDYLIDVEEAKTLFLRVASPADSLYLLIDSLGDAVYSDTAVPQVLRIGSTTPITNVPVQQSTDKPDLTEERSGSAPVAAASASAKPVRRRTRVKVNRRSEGRKPRSR